jgi:hypothetical protein
MSMIGFMQYNKDGNAGFTDNAKGRTTSSVQTCPVCLCVVNSTCGTFPDGTKIATADWVKQVCTQIKDDTVNGGYQAGCAAHAYPPY